MSLLEELTRLQRLYRAERDMRDTHSEKVDYQINTKMKGLIVESLTESLFV
jgi:hypothetical protein